ncbi:helix-turn-helix transcriptional regulator [Kitasatospora aureofaciens]|uniref:helix-turn-helix domain-containing protein n=1 Tax=Kitasatospora aureofaciens TaxID=1894 RepID=UPI001C46B2F4|nr:helix-turn-helix domain-containing protein [Kitasatospora aureofaciens]MBV6699938.1 helix-turn-helix transcriptional regulator [Kitasatospora aureofaciens]
MVESGQRDVIDIAYDNPDRLHIGVEVLTFDALKRRLKSSVARRPSRLDFHQIMLVRGGEGAAMVDFVTHPCVHGTLLHLRPGQVQRLPSAANGRPADLDAVLLLFTADFPSPLPATREVLGGFGPVARRLPPDDFDAFDRAVTEMDAEYRTLRGEQTPDTTALADTDVELTGALLRQLLGALLIRMARLPDPAGRPVPATPGAEVYLAFRRELEHSFATTRAVEDYAARLGYSPRTLTRACLAATGRSAKQLADARVVLQAQRLLAHTDLPVAAIGRTLGFTEATNFGKFFTRETGRTPGDFRRAQR